MKFIIAQSTIAQSAVVVDEITALVKPLLALFSELKNDIAEIEGFMARRK